MPVLHLIKMQTSHVDLTDLCGHCGVPLWKRVQFYYWRGEGGRFCTRRCAEAHDAAQTLTEDKD